MLAILGNLGPSELILILILAVLVFGKDLPQAASKAYLQVRRLRNAVDDLRRETGIDRELRNIERTVREAEWEARQTQPSVARKALASSTGSAPPAPAAPLASGDPTPPPPDPGPVQPPSDPAP